MADSLLDLYLGGGAKVEPEKEQSGSLIDMYLGSSAPVATAKEPLKITVTPRPPMEGLSQAEAAARESIPVNQPSPSVVSKAASGAMALPVDYGSAVKENYMSGVGNITKGLKDIGDNQPASGVGKIGLGALGALTSPLTGAIKSFVDDRDKKI